MIGDEIFEGSEKSVSTRFLEPEEKVLSRTSGILRLTDSDQVLMNEA